MREIRKLKKTECFFIHPAHMYEFSEHPDIKYGIYRYIEKLEKKKKSIFYS